MNGEGTMYPVMRAADDVTRPGYTRLNPYGRDVGVIINQELIDNFNNIIRDANAKTGLNFPEAVFIEKRPFYYPDDTIAPGRYIPAGAYVPAFGFMKHSYGGKL